MSKQRTSGPEAQGTKSAFVQPAETTQSLYSEIFAGLPRGVAILRLENPRDPRTFRIVDVNPAAARFTGKSIEDLRGKKLSEFPKLFETPVPDGLLDTLNTGQSKNLGEIACSDDRGRQSVFSLVIFPVPGNYVGAAFEDITERKKREREMREIDERLRIFVQGVQEYAIFQLNPDGRVVSWNDGAERLKGYRAEEIIGKHFSVFYVAEDVDSGKPGRILGEAVARGQCEDEGWRIRKDGSRFWANVVVTALRNSEGVLQGFVKITRDLTERHDREESLTKAKETLELRVVQRTAVLARVNDELRTEIAERIHIEQQLKSSLGQLRALTARIQSVREEERTSVAREIHDELGQACTAIKMDLALIGRKLTKRQIELKAKVNSTMGLVDDTIAALRRIASELRPRTLDDLGLSAALEWQAQEFQNRTGIACRVALPHDSLLLDTERSTAIFRIFQESLTNVARHAQARRVEARLAKEVGQIILEVHDDGIGFDAEQAKERKSLGLVGMQERAVLLDGELRVEGIPGQGTTLTLKIPLPSPALPSQSSR
jgi:PAS domain S-box-containing protein